MSRCVFTFLVSRASPTVFSVMVLRHKVYRIAEEANYIEIDFKKFFVIPKIKEIRSSSRSIKNCYNFKVVMKVRDISRDLQHVYCDENNLIFVHKIMGGANSAVCCINS